MNWSSYNLREILLEHRRLAGNDLEQRSQGTALFMIPGPVDGGRSS